MSDCNYYRMKLKGLVIWIMAGVTCNLYSQNLDSLISKMTLAEKVGQMAQVDLGVLWEGETCNPKDGKVKLNEDKLKEAITKYKIGSVLNCGCGTGTHSKEEWRQWIGEIQAVAQRSGVLPILYGIDAIHGATYLHHSTLFPQQLGQAATWNPDLVQSGAAVTAYETRASGIPWNFSPVLDVARQPLWSRFFETYGSDPYLCKTMGVAAVQGYQNYSKEISGSEFNGKQASGAISSYNVAACLKHFMGYSAPFSGKDRTPAYFTERDLRDIFLPSFEEAIKAGAKSIMVNSGEISGIPVHTSYRLLTEILRNELGFTGVVVTDWEDIYKLHANHRVAKDYREAVKMSIMAGIDMSMIPNDFQFIDILISLVKDGEIPESRIDQSVRRILQMKKDLGLFSAPMGLPATQFPDAFSDRFKQKALETALQSITLLNNEAVLPLKAGTKAVVCGPAAHSLSLISGAWTHSWLGRDESLAKNYGLGKTVADACSEYGKGISWLFPEKQNPMSLKSLQITKALTKDVKKSDVVVICLGEEPGTEIPGNTESLELDAAQRDYVMKIAAMGKKIVLVCFFNRPLIITELDSVVQAVVYAYLPSDFGPEALAKTLVGINNPSGKLPFTYPRSSGSVVQHDRKHTEDFHVDFSTNAYRPLYDFGFGLSYTQFNHSPLTLNGEFKGVNDTVWAEWTVTNTGKMDGYEVAQLYYRDEFASITPSVMHLTGFKKVWIPAGNRVKIRLPIIPKMLSFVGEDLKRTTEAGDFSFWTNNPSQQRKKVETTFKF